MPCCKERCCTEKCRRNLSSFCSFVKRSLLIVMIQLLGWALFSYAEDRVNVIDCFTNPDRVVATVYPPTNELQKAVEFFVGLRKQTHQVLSLNQSAKMYALFKSHFNVPAQKYPAKEAQAYIACVRWYRFSVLTMSTIGYGTITPKSDVGKLLVIPYALITIPLMLSYLALVGSIVSSWVECAMRLVHRCIKGDKPQRYAHLKRCTCLFIAFWILGAVILSSYISGSYYFSSQGALKWLDGFYFVFITFTTIGFGDITGPANDVGFFTWRFAVGLAIISGFIDTFMAASERLNFSFRRRTNFCCIHYKEDDESEAVSAMNSIHEDPV